MFCLRFLVGSRAGGQGKDKEKINAFFIPLVIEAYEKVECSYFSVYRGLKLCVSGAIQLWN